MIADYRKCNLNDAEVLIDIYNASFYEDYVRYGECPAYGRTVSKMEESISAYPKYLFECDNVPVGVISFCNRGNGEYYIGCLCVIPSYQGRGIGTESIAFFLQTVPDWKTVTLITPADKERNIRFYVKNGFCIEGRKKDGNVDVVIMSKCRD